MANTSTVALEIAGRGHVYYGAVGTEAPDLNAYEFGNGSTLEASGWTWLGDTSIDDMIEYDTDGGDVTNKHTWDRANVKSVREAVTNTVTINVLNLGDDTMQVAFPGSTYDASKDAWDIDLDTTGERAFLVVTQDGQQIAAYLYRRCQVSGSLPTLEDDDFTHTELKLTLLTPPSGRKPVQFLKPRIATGASTEKPTITSITPPGRTAGQSVTIEGTNFKGVRSVTFTAGGATTPAASFVFVSPTRITAVLPQGVQTGNVIVTNNVGASDGVSYTVG